MRHDFLCVNVSNVYFPWYDPRPLGPIPPNGSVSTEIMQGKLVGDWEFSELVQHLIYRVLVWAGLNFFQRRNRFIYREREYFKGI